MPKRRLTIPHATSKTQDGQINKYIKINIFLKKRTKTKMWWVYHFWDELIRDCVFHLAHSFLLVLWMETNCQCMNCPLESPTWQGTEGDLQPTASEELRPSHNDLWWTENYQLPREWAWNRPSPGGDLRWPNMSSAAVRTPQREGPAKSRGGSWPIEIVR